MKSPAEGAGGWFDPFSHEKPERALSLVSLFSDSRDAPTWSESGMSRVPRVSPSHGVEDVEDKVYDKFVGVSWSWLSESLRIPPSGHSSGNSAAR